MKTGPPAAEPKREPSVSVIVPAYQVAAYVGESMASIFAQTFTDYEVIVVNDGSSDTDRLEQALEPYVDRIRYFRQENRGAAEARNHALRVATGEFVAFLDADDVWLPNYLEEQMAFLRHHPECDLVYADALLFGDPVYEGRTYMEFARSNGKVTFSALLHAECNVITSGVVARRRSVADVGFFDPELRRGQDYDLWLRLVRAGAHLAYQRKVLLRRRMHAESLSGDALGQTEREVAVIERFAERKDLTPDEQAIVQPVLATLRANVCTERAKRLLAAGDFAAASQQLETGLRLRPGWKLRLIRLSLRIAPRSLQRFQRWRTGNL